MVSAPEKLRVSRESGVHTGNANTKQTDGAKDKTCFTVGTVSSDWAKSLKTGASQR